MLFFPQRFFEKTDMSKDGQVNFAEFVQYVAEHEKKLRLFFRNIDTNQDGKCLVILFVLHHFLTFVQLSLQKLCNESFFFHSFYLSLD